MKYLGYFISKNGVHLYQLWFRSLQVSESLRHVLAGFCASVHLQEMAFSI